MTFQKIWGALGYIIAVYVAVMMVAYKMPRRKNFTVRLIITLMTIIGYKFLFDYIYLLLPFNDLILLFFRTSDSFVIYILSAVSVAVCFESNFWAVLFCATAGYCMQHMSQRTYLILKSSVQLYNVYLNAFLLVVITALFYVIIYFLFIKPADYRGVMLDNKVQISVSFFAILITIFLNSFALRVATEKIQKIYIMLFSIIVAILIIYIEFGWLAAKKATVEKDFIKRMASDAQRHYRLEKDIVDVINVKVHDLKHQLAGFNGKLGDEDLNTIKEAARIYDSIYKTGNSALDVVLTSKSLMCEKRNIRFTCLIDGNKLSFLTEQEIYSLFGNMLDNAIEAVEKVEDPDNKFISVSSRVAAGMLTIHEENYFAQKPKFVDGLPQTTKGDEFYHGFGVKSIRNISEKYGGSCSITMTENIFEIDVTFPLN